MASFHSHSHHSPSPSPVGLSPDNDDNNPQPRRPSRTSLHDIPAAHSSRSPSREPEDEAAHSSEININADDDDVPVEVLVKHLLAAKQSLSSMTLVLRANDLATSARQMHEECVILSAQTEFLRHGILDEIRILQQVRRGMQRAYDIGTRDFKQIIRDLDTINKRLENTMDILRNTTVESVFRQPGDEDPKCLLDFIDIKVVEQVRDALKVSVDELQAAKTSFDGDLLRFDTDLRTLTDALAAAAAAAASLSNPPPPPDTADGNGYPPDQRSIPNLLSAMSEGSHLMAEHLSSLTRHFDMCVTAVRTTEGGAALARRRAAEATAITSSSSSTTSSSHQLPPVSISGVISAQESASGPSAFEPMDPLERADLLSIVLHDASQVPDVVSDIHTVLSQMSHTHSTFVSIFSSTRSSHAAFLSCFSLLEEIGSRVSTSYIAAETEFVQRWEDEKEAIAENASKMEELQRFYEGYLDAYDGLTLEVKRRRQVEEKIEAVWKKATREVEKLVEGDKRDREHFRLEVGEYVPADLWGVVDRRLGRWVVVKVEDGDGEEGGYEGDGHGHGYGQEEEGNEGRVEAAYERETSREPSTPTPRKVPLYYAPGLGPGPVEERPF